MTHIWILRLSLVAAAAMLCSAFVALSVITPSACLVTRSVSTSPGSAFVLYLTTGCLVEELVRCVGAGWWWCSGTRTIGGGNSMRGEITKPSVNYFHGLRSPEDSLQVEKESCIDLFYFKWSCSFLNFNIDTKSKLRFCIQFKNQDHIVTSLQQCHLWESNLHAGDSLWLDAIVDNQCTTKDLLNIDTRNTSISISFPENFKEIFTK